MRAGFAKETDRIRGIGKHCHILRACRQVEVI